MSGIGDRIRALRKDAGLTISELSRKLYLTDSELNAVENGCMGISEEWVSRVAECFGLNSDELMADAGIVPSDVNAIILKNPKVMCELIRGMDKMEWMESDKMAVLISQFDRISEELNKPRGDAKV